MKIQAVILDGFHKGHVVTMDYMPTVKLLKPRNLSVAVYYDEPNTVNDPIHSYVEYKECFRGIDKNVVLYSEKGESLEFFSMFNKEVSNSPWNEYTTLYFNNHEIIERKQDGTQKTEFDRGFERGIEEGRILQQMEIDKKFTSYKPN